MSVRDVMLSVADDELVRRLASPGDPDLTALIYEAGRRPVREAVPNLSMLLDASDPEIQQQALEALGEIGDEKAAPRVLALLDSEPAQTYLRDTGAWALGLFRYQQGSNRLMRMLRDPAQTVRSCAAAALSALGDPNAVSALRIALALESDANVRDDLDKAIASLVPSTEFPMRSIRYTSNVGRETPGSNDPGRFPFKMDLPPTGSLG